MIQASELIEKLGLVPHPEGGFYKETYRALETVASSALPDRYGADRAFSTAIYFLLTAESFSALHRIESDEIFHFYGGDPVQMLQLHPTGEARTLTLGARVDLGHQPQVIVPKGTWQGARLSDEGRWALMGCTVAPGFAFDDSELGEAGRLLSQLPAHKELIRRFLPSKALPR